MHLHCQMVRAYIDSQAVGSWVAWCSLTVHQPCKSELATEYRGLVWPSSLSKSQCEHHQVNIDNIYESLFAHLSLVMPCHNQYNSHGSKLVTPSRAAVSNGLASLMLGKV